MNLVQLLRLFNLRRGLDTADNIEAVIRHGVTLGGTNMWVLMLAILTASIGLNVNSVPVIIGAMLISPLMGPILAIGYGAAGNDTELMRQAARNLGIYVLVSLATSTVYFFISPLNEVSSELLARAHPTLWDVLIAFVGGAAGIVALSRKSSASVGNVMPGVAIATALMPPLCTAGYGIAHGYWWMAAGALYLLFINGVFIAFATLLLSRLMRITTPHFSSETQRQRRRALVGTLVLLTALPSVYLAYNLVQEQVFNQRARSVVQQLHRQKEYVVISSRIDAKQKKIEITLGGTAPPVNLAKTLSEQMAVAGSKEAHFDVRYAGIGDAESQKLLRELLNSQNNVAPVLVGDVVSVSPSSTATKNEGALASQSVQNTLDTEAKSLLRELQVLYPQVKSLSLSKGVKVEISDGLVQSVTVIRLKTSTAMESKLRAQMRQWLMLRYGKELELYW